MYVVYIFLNLINREKEEEYVENIKKKKKYLICVVRAHSTLHAAYAYILIFSATCVVL